jgi:hypothetical protein
MASCCVCSVSSSPITGNCLWIRDGKANPMLKRRASSDPHALKKVL